jgi:hypothetical protein
MLANDLAHLRSHILLLAYDERVEANELLRRWQNVKRLTQLQQLRVEQLVNSIDRTIEAKKQRRVQ